MKHRYVSVGQESLSKYHIEAEASQNTRNRKNVVCVLIAVWLTLGLLLGTFLDRYRSATNYREIYRTLGTYEHGFATERLLPPSKIAMTILKFGGNPFFLSNGTEVIQFDPRVPNYVGEPATEVDDNWEYLIEGRYFYISSSEGELLWGDNYTDFLRRDKHGVMDGISGGFDVFHSLHCLNELRKRLSPQQYPRTHLHGPKHDMHCINHIRQVLQCDSVASIIPSLYRPTVGMQYSDAGQPHVCRDFGQIHNFTRERYSKLTGTNLKEWREIVY